MTARGFLSVRVEGLEPRHIQFAIEGIDDLSQFWPEVLEPCLDRARRMYDSVGFGKWADYSGEPIYEHYKREQLGRELTAADIGRWSDTEPDSTSWAINEELAPSLLNPHDPNFHFASAANRCEIGTKVEHAADFERDTTGPDYTGGEPSPARALFEYDDQFIFDLSDAMSVFAAKVIKQSLGNGEPVRAGMSQADVIAEAMRLNL